MELLLKTIWEEKGQGNRREYRSDKEGQRDSRIRYNIGDIDRGIEENIRSKKETDILQTTISIQKVKRQKNK